MWQTLGSDNSNYIEEGFAQKVENAWICRVHGNRLPQYLVAVRDFLGKAIEEALPHY